MPDFGIGELIAALGTTIGSGIGALGVGEATAGILGTGLADALVGAGGGALLGGITGGDPGMGALGGALTGGGFGVGGALAGDIGVGTGIGEAIGGGLGGAAAGLATGQNPLLTAGLGTLPGLGDVAFGGAGATAPGAATSAPGPSAAASAPLPGAANASFGGTGSPDLTAGGGAFSGLDTGNLITPSGTIGAQGPIGAAGPTGAITPSTGTADSLVAGAGGNAFNWGSYPLSTPGGAPAPWIDPTANAGAGALTGPPGGDIFNPGAGTPQQVALNAAANAPNAISNIGALDPTNAAGSVASDAAAFDRLAATYGVGGAGATGGNTIENAWNNPTWGNIGKAVGSNLGPLAAGGGLLANLFKGNSIPGLSNLTQEAQLLQGQGADLQSYLKTGTLPPGAQAQLDLQSKGAEAKIKGFYANLGMSGSSAEAQDLSNLKLATAAQSFQMANDLMNTGIKETGLSADIFGNLVKLNQYQDEQTGQAIANFAGALAGSGTGRGVTLNIPGLA